MVNDAIARFDSVTLRRGTRAVLHEFTAEFPAGCTRVAGRNGAGKSTVLRALAGDLRFASGTCTIFDHDVRLESTRLLRNVAPHHVGLVPALSIDEHLALTMTEPESLEDAERLLTELALDRWRGAPSCTLSTGSQRKAWLILCLARRRPLHILDEPFNGLDDEASATVGAILSRWLEAGEHIVLASHLEPPLPVSAVIELPKDPGGQPQDPARLRKRRAR